MGGMAGVVGGAAEAIVEVEGSVAGDEEVVGDGPGDVACGGGFGQEGVLAVRIEGPEDGLFGLQHEAGQVIEFAPGSLVGGEERGWTFNGGARGSPVGWSDFIEGLVGMQFKSA